MRVDLTLNRPIHRTLDGFRISGVADVLPFHSTSIISDLEGKLSLTPTAIANRPGGSRAEFTLHFHGIIDPVSIPSAFIHSIAIKT